MEIPSRYQLLGESPEALKEAGTALADACVPLFLRKGAYENCVTYPLFGSENEVLARGCDAITAARDGDLIAANDLLKIYPELSEPFREFRRALMDFLPSLVGSIPEEKRFDMNKFQFSIASINRREGTLLAPHNDTFRLVQSTFSSSGSFFPLRVFQGNHSSGTSNGIFGEDGPISKAFPYRKMKSVPDGRWIDADPFCIHKVSSLESQGIRVRAFAMIYPARTHR